MDEGDHLVRFIGDPDKGSVSVAFALGLRHLPPTLRQLALAQACVAPWQTRGEAAPACFQCEFDRAVARAAEEYPQDPTITSRVDSLFDVDPCPVQELLLEQIADMVVVHRYRCLMMAIYASDLQSDWLNDELDYIAILLQEERRVWQKQND